MKKAFVVLAIIVVSISINLNVDKVESVANSTMSDSLYLPIHPPII
ncbi:hypothetical protein SAMN05421670_2477 [Psychrobacillus psychrotolerans]|uniref:Uncharacterized protein n=1 Tax=Psychrobacillus psychrotolerans TaxID=126156 RepID=A0A1I5Z7T0_9BACI|nr:hypothetical protein [Psychrobacillus psychrotolerans]SFQ52520.1 hypothetical protein SAMN05421670_2477 [Psychrobacillus psychrotolerans]